MALTASMNLYVTGKQTTAADLGTGTFPFGLSVEHALTDGTTAGKADRVFTDTRTLGPSATENLDLAGTLTDIFGAVITFVTIKAVIIRAAVANNAANAVVVTRPAANGVALFTAVSAGVSLPPGYAFAFMGTGTGITVTPATGDLITVTNSAGTNSVNYDVVVIGTSS